MEDIALLHIQETMVTNALNYFTMMYPGDKMQKGLILADPRQLLQMPDYLYILHADRMAATRKELGWAGGGLKVMLTEP
jgi:hypothetical protein